MKDKSVVHLPSGKLSASTAEPSSLTAVLKITSYVCKAQPFTSILVKGIFGMISFFVTGLIFLIYLTQSQSSAVPERDSNPSLPPSSFVIFPGAHFATFSTKWFFLFSSQDLGMNISGRRQKKCISQMLLPLSLDMGKHLVEMGEPNE